MKTTATFFTIFLFVSCTLFAQVGINPDSSNPDVSAMLDVKSTSKGMLAPRMTAAQRDAISNPAKGLLIYCTDNDLFYSNKGTPSAPGWEVVSSQWLSQGSNIHYSAGSVGIGTAYPSGKLHVSTSNSNTEIKITSIFTGDSATLLLAEDGGTNGLYWMYDGAGNQMELWGRSGGTKYGPHMLFNRSEGNIACGSVLSSCDKLSVNGSALFTQAGINTDNSTPHASAILDLKSTSRGFLPPRMSTVQRDAILSPAAGLTVYNTNKNCNETYNGSSWVSNTHYLGESYGGGKVFYVYDDGQHGLIAATTDQSFGKQWYNGIYRFTGSSGDGLHAGVMNTTLIVATQLSDNQTGSFAAKVCADYSVTFDGILYGDWYLPSAYELNLLRLNRNYVGGFSGLVYWCATECDPAGAWHQNILTGVQACSSKNELYYVRAIRAF